MSKRKSEDETNELVKVPKLCNERERFIAFDQDPSPEIFKLDVDCCNVLFDRLSLQDLHSIGQTCKRLNKIAVGYFQEKYHGLEFCGFNDGVRYKGVEFKAFSPYVQNVVICESSLEKCQYIGANCKSLKRIHFNNLMPRSISADQIDCIKGLLPKIETVELSYCYFEGDVYDDFLKLCTSLKKLTIHGNRTGNGWLNREYPKLEHVDHYGEPTYEDMRMLFERNPNIRNFGYNSSHLLNDKDSWLTSGLKFDRLIITALDQDEVETCDLLNDLRQRGFYKKLQQKMAVEVQQEIDAIATLNGLDVLIISIWNDYVVIPVMPDVKRIQIRSATLNQLRSFVISAKQLKEMNLAYFYNGDFLPELMPANLMEWNKERGKLNGASKLTIYVSDKVLKAFESAHYRTKFNLIEIKSVNEWEDL